jgi:DNA mismatch endonuclease (patch repair protein)
MADVLTLEQRRFNMSRIRGRDTKPELIVRFGLHARGLRFRLHRKELPGCPDLVFPCFRAVVFVHGCFWHGHDCPMFKLPATRAKFWAAKIEGNRTRDARARKGLVETGWRTMVLWECALRGPSRRPVETVLDEVAEWLRTQEFEGVVQGNWRPITDS